MLEKKARRLSQLKNSRNGSIDFKKEFPNKFVEHLRELNHVEEEEKSVHLVLRKKYRTKMKSYANAVSEMYRPKVNEDLKLEVEKNKENASNSRI